MKTRILIADDHRIIREGLRSLLEKQSDMSVVAEAADGRTAVELTRQLMPDVVIMDVAMPHLNGVEATRQITSQLEDVKVIALSMYSDRRSVAQMLKAGASGYLIKDCDFGELVRAICTVVAGQTYLSSGITGVVIRDYVDHLSANEFQASPALSAREREVLQLLSEGRTTRQAASRLHVSVKTIETHRRRIMGKLNIHSVAELTKYAIREGMTSLET